MSSERSGIGSLGNLAFLLAVLFAFPFVLRWTGALSVADVSPQSPKHTRAFLKLCLVLAAFLWMAFLIALVGIRRSGKIKWPEVVRAKWNGWQVIVGDLAVAIATLVAMAVIGNLFTVALWRKSLVPGMIAHGLGDGLVAFIFFSKHL